MTPVAFSYFEIPPTQPLPVPQPPYPMRPIQQSIDIPLVNDEATFGAAVDASGSYIISR